MSYSFCLLTVTWIAAAPMDASAGPGCNCAASAQVSAPVVYQQEVGPRALGFRDRLRGLFGLPPQAPAGNRVATGIIVRPLARTGEPPAVVQSAYTSYHQGVPAPSPAVNEPSPNLQVAAKYQEKVGHETDYSWITGHLFYVHTNGGKWVLRYTTLDEVDRFGGSVVLTPTVEMKNYREGDLVNVFGEVLNGGQSARPLGGALYRVNSIQLIERADPS